MVKSLFLFFIAFLACSVKEELLLLMTVLAQAFFAFVRGHLVAFSFLSAGHFTLSLEVNIEIYPL